MSDRVVSIAIPTLDRGPLLLETLELLMSDGEASEILVVDQTAKHAPEIRAQLASLHQRGRISWIRLPTPSIPGAMNVALRAAGGEIVLFLDDDILPAKGLVRAHAANYDDPGVVAVVGQVIQPWQTPSDLPRPERRKGIREDFDFPFHSIRRAIVGNCMAGNLSVRRDRAIAAGGFDERFIGAAYRFETEFCRRLARHSGKTVFDPKASVNHLKAEVGGIRVFGDGVKESSIEHSVGDYYFAFLESYGIERALYIGNRILRTALRRDDFLHMPRLSRRVVLEIKSILLAKRLYNEKRRNLVDSDAVSK